MPPKKAPPKPTKATTSKVPAKGATGKTAAAKKPAASGKSTYKPKLKAKPRHGHGLLVMMVARV